MGNVFSLFSQQQIAEFKEVVPRRAALSCVALGTSIYRLRLEFFCVARECRGRTQSESSAKTCSSSVHVDVVVLS